MTHGAAQPVRRPRGAADRVRLVHLQTRWTVPVAVALLATATLTHLLGASRWAVVHLVLAGALVLLISAVTLMLTVTWAAAPAPPPTPVLIQRAAVVAGVGMVVLGREAALAPWVVVVGAALHLVGLLLLAGLLVHTVRRGVKRRFDVAVAGYVVALLAGAAAVVIGAVMAVDAPHLDLRRTHLVLNLLGLVGLVVMATLPHFTATVVRSKMSPAARPPRPALILGWQAASLVVAVVGLGLDEPGLAAVGLGAYVVGIVLTALVMPPPTSRQFRWAGPRLVSLWAGILWWAVAVGASASDAARGQEVLTGRWLWVLVTAAFGQLVWGSLAYLLPVLRGGGHVRLTEGFATTRSWVGLAAVNVVGLGLVARAGTVASVAGLVWVVDWAWRVARLGLGRGSTGEERG